VRDSVWVAALTGTQLVPEMLSYAGQDDLGDTHLDDFVPRIHRHATTFAFEPTFVLHDAPHVGDLCPDEFRLGTHKSAGCLIR